MLSSITMALALTAMVHTPVPAAQDGPVRHDFDGEELGEWPAGWVVPESSRAGYEAGVVEREGGGRCVRLWRTDAGSDSRFGNLRRTVDAEPYRGKRVRLQVSLRADRGARVQAWLRVDRADGVIDALANMDDRPVTSSAWDTYEIVLNVHPEAEELNLGVMLTRGEAGYFDELELEVIGERPAGAPPRELGVDELDRVEAFARLFGLVRYFHPGEGVDRFERWERLAAVGAEVAEAAGGPRELAADLRSLLLPLAPELSIHATGDEVRLPDGLDRPPEGRRVYVRSWVHHGVGLGSKMGPYSSVRTKQRVRNGELPEGVIEPGTLFQIDLPSGVSCAFPLSLYQADSESNWEPDGEAMTGLNELLGEDLGLGADDRWTRLAAVIVAWSVFEHFYPYFEEVEVDWDEQLRTGLASASTDPGIDAFDLTLKRMVAALRDGHGGVYGGPRPRGVLPLGLAWIDDQLIVTHAPADVAGLSLGDAILAIDGDPAPDLLRQAEALASGATPQWIRHRVLAWLGAGAPGSNAHLSVASFGTDAARDVSIERREFSLDHGDLRPEPVAELEPGIWYVDIDRISDADFDAALDDLATAEGLVFDFRGYPRNIQPSTFFPHLIDATAHSANWLVPITRRPYPAQREYRESKWTLEPEQPYLEADRVFITDGRAISYAESCMGIVEHYQLGEIVGGPTAGTNGNVNPLRLPGGFQIMWTGMKVTKHDGSRHHGVGILPTVPVERTRAGIAAGRDELLEAALERLR